MMKRIYTIGLILCFSLVATKVYSFDFEVDGLCYNKLSDSTVELTWKALGTPYTGDVVVPGSVNYRGKRYEVVAIGEFAMVDIISLYNDHVDSCGKNSNLVSVSLPSSILSINQSAFILCVGLTSITIPNSVTSIGGEAFSYCTGLTSITIPNSVTSIGSWAFNGCSGLTSIKVDRNNKNYDSRNNCNAIIKTSSNTLIVGCKNTVIPNSVTSIGSSAFSECSSLTSITIPNSVTSIGNSAFYGCSGLSSITIPNSVTSIGSSAFSECSSLTSITIPNSVTSIGFFAFSGCSGLTSITIPNSVTSIGEWAFFNCSGLTSIISEIKTPFAIDESVFSSSYTKATLTVPAGTRSKYLSTNYWNKFTNIVEAGGKDTSIKRTIHVATAGTLPNLIPESEKYIIEEMTLTGELNGTDFRLLRDMAGCNYLGEETSGKLKVLDIANVKIVVGGEKYLDTDYLPNWNGNFHYTVDKDNELPQFVFHGCKFTSITISNFVTSIGYGAFSDCGALTSIAIHNSVTSIGYYAFYYCKSLASITIPNSVTSIGNAAFFKCSGLTSITIPNSVTSIGSGAFSDCSGLTSIKVESGNAKYDSRNNCNAIIETSTNTLLTGCKNTVIPNSVTTIGSSAFSQCSGLTSITIPNSVTSIGKSAFYGCSGLSSITIPNSVTSIGYSAFSGCSGLTSITIPNSVTSIGEWAFLNCSGLTSITIPNSVTSIGDCAFLNCSGLTDVISEIQNPFEIEEDVFSSSYTKATLTVPSGTKTKYQQTNYWNKFTNIIEKEGENDQSFIDKLNKIKKDCEKSRERLTEYKNRYYDIEEYEIGSKWNVRQYYDDGDKFLTELETLISYCEDKIFKGQTVTQQEREELYEKGILGDFGETMIGSMMNYICSVTVSCNGSGQVRTWIDEGYNSRYGDTVLRNETKTLYWLYPKFGESYPDAGYTHGFLDLSVEPDEGNIAEVNGEQVADNIHLHGEGNYDVTFVKSTTNKIILTAESYTREYGDSNPNFSYSVGGGSINGTPKLTCSATKYSPVGTYTIKIEQGGVTNSNVEYVNGTLTITKTPLTIAAKSCTRKQGESNPTFEVTYSGFKNDETETVLTRKPTVTCSATTSSPAGMYDITVSGAEAQNYSFTYVNGVLTVTEDSQVSISYRGVTYIGQPSTLTAEVQSVYNDNLMEVEIPSSVESNGKTYKVTSVADGAFSNRTFNYVSLPSSVTSISENTFKNTSLGALIWNAKASLPSSVFSNMAIWTKTTFLLYVNDKSYAPLNFGNVVVGSSTYTAENITLEDGTNTMFYCPKEFTAQSITYTHKYSLETGGKGKGWETIALPFNVQKITHASKGELTPFASYQSGSNQRPFWLMELSSSGFTRASAIKANTPYIIAMPNSTEYEEYYIIRGNVTFSANNVKVAETSSLVTRTSTSRRTSTNMTFTPAFVPQTNVYALNVYSDINPGSEFIANQKVYPFQAYMTTNSNTRSIGIEFDNGTTDIDEIPLSGVREGRVRVYSLGGQLLINSDESNWESLWQRLPSGVYIVNGKKTIK